MYTIDIMQKAVQKKKPSTCVGLGGGGKLSFSNITLLFNAHKVLRGGRCFRGGGKYNNYLSSVY